MRLSWELPEAAAEGPGAGPGPRSRCLVTEAQFVTKSCRLARHESRFAAPPEAEAWGSTPVRSNSRKVARTARGAPQLSLVIVIADS